VSDDSGRTPLIGLDNARAALAGRGYVLTDDQKIGLPNKFRHSFRNKYFNDRVLQHDEGDRPIDRKRARDVIRYQWRDDGLHLWEHDTITITDRADIPGKRDHSRVLLLNDPEAEALVRTFLSLVPPERRRREGTFGINLFRTFTKVVTKPHHDDEEFVMLYVLDRIGDGAESYLYLPEHVTDAGEPTADPQHRHQLDPGQILVFEDKRFKHGATPLKPPPGGTARRDVLVCTVDYPGTYLRETPSSGAESALAGSGAH
jgi:2OG-Fe dioxygenase